MIEIVGTRTHVDLTATAWCDYLMAWLISSTLPRYEYELCAEWITTFLRPAEDF